MTALRARRSLRILRGAAAACGVGLLCAPAFGQLPVSLSQVEVPRPTKAFIPGKSQGSTHDLAEIIPPEKEAAAVRLGKALFWDMQAGSDGQVACATCHFHAGTDSRAVNTLNPGSGGAFDVRGADRELQLSDFPLRKLSDPEIRPSDPAFPGQSTVLSDADDVVGSQGVPKARFREVVAGSRRDAGRPEIDRTFHRNRGNVRQVTGRNTPSVINAVFNYAIFWDGRANHFFNGQNPFGPQDPDARIWVDDGAGPQPELMLLNNSSLASQAVGPPLSEVEMSWAGRTFPELGRKMIPLTPLATQKVHAADSVLGPVANSQLQGNPDAPGLGTTYEAMIRAAFAPRFWQSTGTVTIGGRDYTLMEANFALFWGLAIQMYESTLVADDTPFDRFLLGDPTALTARQQRGMNLFFSGATACGDCHIGPELTAASITQLLSVGEAGLIEAMPMGDNQIANYDIGFYNIGVRPTAEDRGRGGKSPFDNPLAFARQAVIRAGLVPGSDELGFVNFDPDFIPDPGCIPDPFALPVPRLCPPTGVARVAVEGAFKVPSLRNVELTGPYFHNGGQATLKQVVEFYTRGGDFLEDNLDHLDPLIRRIQALVGHEDDQDALVDFLLTLTDDRVRWEMAPFDHPELRVPNGHTNAIVGNPKKRQARETEFMAVPAVGGAGRAARGLGPLRPFLWDGTATHHFNP